jgi:hypothetical protein
MTTRTIYHVLPHGDQWAVKINQGKRSSSLHARKTQAMRAASALAKGHPSSQVVIHAATGKIRGDRTFENRDYAKKRKIRAVVSKIKKTKAKNLQKVAKRRTLRRKAAKLGLDRKRRARLVRSRAAKSAALKRRR